MIHFYCNRKKIFLSFLLSVMSIHPMAAAEKLAIPALIIATSALSAGAYTAWQAINEYREVCETPQHTRREKTEYWLVCQWNKVQRGILGRISAFDIFKQDLIEIIYQSNGWWRQYKNVITKFFISFSMTLMGLAYLHKGLKNRWQKE